MRLPIWAFAALLAFASTPSLTAEPQAPATPTRPADWADRVSHGLALAKVSQNEDGVVSGALKQLDEGLVKAMSADPELKKIETEFPGFLQRYYTTARPQLAKLLSARLPQLWQSMAEAYAEEMTVSEIDGQVQYLKSPLGQKMQRLLTDNFDSGEVLGSAVGSGVGKDADRGAGQKELAAASGMAMLFALSQLNDAERSDFLAYTSSPAGKAAQRAGNGVMVALVSWMNADDPEADATMTDIARRVLAQMRKEKQPK